MGLVGGFYWAEQERPVSTGKRCSLPDQDAVLALPMDVEDLARLGRRKGACPYYAARAALPEADLVLLPYSALLAQVRPVLAGHPQHRLETTARAANSLVSCCMHDMPSLAQRARCSVCARAGDARGARHTAGGRCGDRG